MKQCTHCKEWKEVDQYHKHNNRADGLQSECIDCRLQFHARNNQNRMWIDGKYIPQSHPLHKPGRYKSLDDAWSHCEIDERSSEGDVYIIRNMAWPNWYKVGKAVDAKDRLKGYQTSSPHRDFVLCHKEHFKDRHKAEKAIHKLLRKHKSCHDHKGEWFNTYVPTIQEVMRGYKEEIGEAT